MRTRIDYSIDCWDFITTQHCRFHALTLSISTHLKHNHKGEKIDATFESSKDGTTQVLSLCRGDIGPFTREVGLSVVVETSMEVNVGGGTKVIFLPHIYPIIPSGNISIYLSR